MKKLRNKQQVKKGTRQNERKKENQLTYAQRNKQRLSEKKKTPKKKNTTLATSHMKETEQKRPEPNRQEGKDSFERI